MADADIEAARLALERQKWEAEQAFRAREIALKEREQKLSNWTNPLTVAVSVAALAWVGNVVATWWNGRLQRVMEQDKATQELQLAESKAESERILEMIKTGDAATAVNNLKFLLDTGLIGSPERIARLHAYLEKTPPGSGPALPAAGARFDITPSDTLPRPAATALQNNLNAFIAFLDKAGFAAAAERVQIRVETLRSPNAEYHGDDKLILIDRRIVDDPYPAHREYMHHLLFGSKPGNEWASAIGGLENGVADYFSASFSNNPVLGAPQTSRTLGMDQPFIRRLDNDLSYTKYQPGDQPHRYGEMWGAAFWDMRQQLGAEATDRALAKAWQSMAWPVEEVEIVDSFLRALMTAVGTEVGDKGLTEARGIMRKRKVPLPR